MPGVSPGIVAILVFGLGLIAWLSARAKARAFAPLGEVRRHSVPGYHGWYVALWAVIPASIFFLVWQFVSPALVVDAVLSSPAASELPADAMNRGAVLNEARSLASGELAGAFNPLSEKLAPAFRSAASYYGLIGGVVTLLLAFAGGAFAWTRLKRDFRARTKVERVVMIVLLLASLIAILTTLGIVLSLLFESLRFFSLVSPFEFLFGLTW